MKHTEPYLIALDLDGTLLKSDMTIGGSTANILKILSEQGHAITIATGRILKLAQTIPPQLGFKCHLVACNGAIVLHQTEGVVAQHVYAPSRMATLCNFLNDLGIYYHYYSEDTIYASAFAHTAKKFYDLAQNHPPESRLTVEIIGDTHHDLAGQSDVDSHAHIDRSCRTIAAHSPNVYKFGIYNDGTYDFEKVRGALDAMEGLCTMFSAPNLLDIMQVGVSKWSGIVGLANHLGIPSHRIIAFGDNENDIEMLTQAAFGVVMGNAGPEIKALGSHITGTNDEEGIYSFLKDYFF